MSNNSSQSSWLKALTASDKILAIAAISYGIYLYIQLGVFNNGEFIQNPMSWVVGGGISLAVSLINIPNLLFQKMRKSMVVSK